MDPGVRTGPTIHRRGQAAYDRARRSLVWQARLPDRYPSEILEARTAADVVAAVRRASAAGRQVSVVSSGHSYCASGIQQDRVLIDLSRLQELEVVPESRLAHVQVGITNGRLDAALGPHELAFPIGHSSSVALGGYLLGGGLGWNSEAWGQAACFSVLAADAVLANGDIVQITAHDEPDLFWALRGAGPLFPGIVTQYSLALQPRPAAIAQISRSYALSEAAPLSSWIEAALPRKDLNVELAASFETLKAPRALETKAITLNAVSFGDGAQAAERKLDDLTRSLPSAGALTPLTREFTSFPALLAQNDVSPDRHAVETVWTNDIACALTVLASSFEACPSSDSSVHVSLRPHPELASHGAYSITAKALVFCASAWKDEAQDERNIEWCEAVVDALAPMTVGRYVNETDYVTHPDRIEASFSPAAFERITRIRANYDPRGLFDHSSPLPAPASAG